MGHPCLDGPSGLRVSITSGGSMRKRPAVEALLAKARQPSEEALCPGRREVYVC